MKKYTGIIDFQDDLIPIITVQYRGRKCQFLTFGKRNSIREAYTDDYRFLLLTFNRDQRCYILECLEPQGIGHRRVHAISTLEELRALNRDQIPSDALLIIKIMERFLVYDHEAFKDAHANASSIIAERRRTRSDSPLEERFFSNMMNVNRLSDDRRKKIKSAIHKLK